MISKSFATNRMLFIEMENQPLPLINALNSLFRFNRLLLLNDHLGVIHLLLVL